MNRQELKFDAKDKMRQAEVNPYAVTVILGVIIVVLSAIQTVLRLWGEMIRNDHYSGGGQLSAFLGVSLIFFIIFFVIQTILNFGYRTYCLKVANRDTSMSYGDLFDAVRFLLKALGLGIMISLFTFLWSLLLIIPGIIAAFRYSQAVFIMVEDPKKGIMECIRESKEIMDGHKMEYFILELSFCLWALLSVVTCGLGYIYVYPYMMVTLANYYNSLKPVTVVREDAGAYQYGGTE